MSETYATAYSTDLKKDLDPMEAYQFSLEKKVADSHNFQCSKNCHFKLTLVNFGKNPQDFVKPPHFRTSNLEQKHEKDCPIVQSHYESRKGTSSQSLLWNRTDSKVIVEIDLINGLLAKIKNSETVKTNLFRSEETTITRTNTSSKNNNEKEIKLFLQHIKSLRKLIQLYFSYLQGEKYQFVDKNNQQIDLNIFFTKLSVYKMITEGHISIYYGKAKVFFKDCPEGPYFHLRFTSPCRMNNLRGVAPSVNINLKKAEHHGVKGKISELKKLAKSKKSFTLFYFGSFKEVKKQYINFSRPTEQILDFLIFNLQD